MAGISMGLPLAPWKALASIPPAPAQAAAATTPFTPEEEQLLDELERSSFLFFWEQASPQTGLIKDRCNARATDTGVVALA